MRSRLDSTVGRPGTPNVAGALLVALLAVGLALAAGAVLPGVVGGINGDTGMPASEERVGVTDAERTLYALADENRTAPPADTGEMPGEGPVSVVATSVPANPVGDATGDGDITIADAQAVANYVIGGNPSPFDANLANVTRASGGVGIADAQRIAEYTIGGVDRAQVNVSGSTLPATVEAGTTLGGNVTVENAGGMGAIHEVTYRVATNGSFNETSYQERVGVVDLAPAGFTGNATTVQFTVAPDVAAGEYAQGLFSEGLESDNGSLTANLTVERPPYAGGNGTEDDPYGIATWAHLDNVRENPGANFTLVSDLDSGTSGYTEVAGTGANNGSGFEPIGDSATPFTGAFDGNGSTIRGLVIDRPNETAVGPFGNSSGLIENVTLVDANVTGNERVGGLAGRNGGDITDSSASGTVTGSDEVGGLVGGAVGNSRVVNASATGAVSGDDRVGGLLGENAGNVSRSYATGNVTGTNSVGGLVGRNEGQVEYAYATATVSAGGFSVGGLVGANGLGGDVTRSYAAGAVSSSTDEVGGLVGLDDGLVGGSYWDIERTGQQDSASAGNGSTGLATAEMRGDDNQMAALDFSGTWAVVDEDLGNNQVNVSYPYLADNPQTPAPGLATVANETVVVSGSVTANETVENATVEAFDGSNLLARTETGPNGTYRITEADIGDGENTSNLSVSVSVAGTVEVDGNPLYAGARKQSNGTTLDFSFNASADATVTIRGENRSVVYGVPDGDTGANPIANAAMLQSMAANTGGSYELVRDINATETATWDGGNGFEPIETFSGSFDGNGHTIAGLYIDRGTEDGVGLFGASRLSAGVQDLTIVGANVTGGSNVGVLIGQEEGRKTRSGSVVTDIRVRGAVDGNDTVGGVVGRSYGGLNRASTAVDVTGTDQVGGLAGTVVSATVTDSYATGNVTGDRRVGGLVGQALRSETLTGIVVRPEVTTSYATGTVAGETVVGGLVGRNIGGTVTDSYATGTVAIGQDAGGLVGINTWTVSNSYWDAQTTGQSRAVGTNGGETAAVEGLFKTQLSGETPAPGNGDTMPAFDFNGTWATTGSHYPVLQSQDEQAQLAVRDDIDIEESMVVVLPPVESLNSTNGTQTIEATVRNQYAGQRTQDIELSITESETGTEILTDTKENVSVGSGDTETVKFNISLDTAGKLDVTVASNDDSTTDAVLAIATEISDWKELHLTRFDLDRDYRLSGNLTETTAGYDTFVESPERGWDPLGGGPISFSGGLDGNGHTIANLTVNRSAESVVGLFAGARGPVSNLTLADVDVAGSSDVGALAGTAGAPISNVSITGTVTGTGDVGGLVGGLGAVVRNASAAVSVSSDGNNIGGLVGSSSAGEVIDSSVAGSVTGSNAVGGVIGKMYVPRQVQSSGTAMNPETPRDGRGSGAVGLQSSLRVVGSYATANVTGDKRVGGLAGSVNPITASGGIFESYATGDVTGNDTIGGLVGYSSRVSNSYATGNVTGDTSTGGIAGRSSSFSDGVENSYWDLNTTGRDDAVGGSGSTSNVQGLSTDQMQGATAAGNMDQLDFNNTWATVSSEYPVLQAIDEDEQLDSRTARGVVVLARPN